ncbi:hypothetical protein DQ392_08590 [Streptomyces reniochalinae]|uniref:Uncharacterized protein n=1 Tax=Streptomyces reniochalinae TaxID=2250578 RepID=A0A367EVZ8_9ACTN|nr:hypothetical protein DQ392_08590 [Streptomyces reniochalinae]
MIHVASKGRGSRGRSSRGNAETLKRYWGQGRGAAKIKWYTPGDFRRCERHLRKYLGARAKGYCARLHRERTGVWPGDKRNIGRRR